jgi:hypothetical protein
MKIRQQRTFIKNSFRIVPKKEVLLCTTSFFGTIEKAN